MPASVPACSARTSPCSLGGSAAISFSQDAALHVCLPACMAAWPLRLLCVLAVQCLCNLRAPQLLWLQVVSATINRLSRTCAACVAQLLQTSSCRSSPSSSAVCLRRFWEEEYKFPHVSPCASVCLRVSPCVSAGFGRKNTDFRMCLRVSPRVSVCLRVSPQVLGGKIQISACVSVCLRRFLGGKILISACVSVCLVCLCRFWGGHNSSGSTRRAKSQAGLLHVRMADDRTKS